MRDRIRTTWAMVTLACAVVVSVAAAEETADFVLREQLGHGWSNECVSFTLNATQLKNARQGRALLGPGGQETACQLSESGGAAKISFQADISPYQTLTYVFSGEAAKPRTDLEVTETAEEIRMANGRIGIEIRKRLSAGQGPLARIRLGSGVWTGGSLFEGGGAPTDYKVEILARGPVFAEAVCRATFGDQGEWTMRFRVERAEPVVLVDEYFDVPTGGTFRVVLGDKAFQPSHLMNRNSDVTSAAVESGPIVGYFMEPWLRWNNPRHGNWIALYTPTPPAPGKIGETAIARQDKTRDASPDMLVVGVLRPSLWRDPQWKGRAGQVEPNVQATVRDGLMGLELPVRGGRRLWMLAALDKTVSADILKQKNRCVAPPPQQLLIKHGDFPLDKVKDYVLDWKGDDDNHPLLYVLKRDLPALRTRLKSDPAELRRWTGEQPIDKYFLDGPIKEFIASGDKRLGQLIAARGAEYLQTCVDWYLKQDERLTIGAAPHMQTLITTSLSLLDSVLSTDSVTPEARKRMLAQIAFLGYVVNSPDYWSPERGYTSFANMQAVVALFRTELGCMVPSHPMAREWAGQGLNELKRELLAWSDEDGGWLEAPHYAMVSYDILLGAFSMAAKAGYGDYLYEPRMRKVAEWFARIATPRDSRTGGFRHHPPIGNTYNGEPTGVFGMLAGLWKDRDPEFASQMQWMYQEQGAFGEFGIGWNFPTMLGYKFLINASDVTPRAPAYGSAWFRQTGVVLRNSAPSERETYLHVIAGWNHDHYDFDSGGIVLYGKGRILSDDWGYIGRNPAQWHSMLTSWAASGGDLMHIKAFAPSGALDYVSGTKGAWRRQIAFVKDADPLGPNFFLIRDTHDNDAAAAWRLWLAVKMDASSKPASGTNATSAPKPPAVVINAQGAFVAGAEDVDLDIFFHEPDKLNLKLEPGVQRIGTSYQNGQVGALNKEQTALVGGLPGRGAVVFLLYPRLKTEPSPKVTWLAGGRGAKVETAAGVDCVFVGPKRPRTALLDTLSGANMRPLDTVEQWAFGKSGMVLYKQEDMGTPSLTVNRTEADFAASTFKLPRQTIAMHPGPSNAVTAVWRSPVKGKVNVEVRLRDGDSGGGDGIAYELRQGAQVLGQGVLEHGAEEATLKTEPVAVVPGGLMRLLILPRGSNWWDTTIVEMIVRNEDGKQWNLREWLVGGNKLGNEPGIDPTSAVWWVCEGDAEQFAPDVAEEFACEGRKGKGSFQGTAGALQIRGKTVTLTLGAAGKLRVGDKVLESDAPNSRKETR